MATLVSSITLKISFALLDGNILASTDSAGVSFLVLIVSISMSFMHGPKSAAASQGIAVETLTTTLNKSLEPVIDVILKHGGDIIKFAGDALIVICYVPGAIASHLQKGLTLTPCRLNITVAFVKLEGVVDIKNAQTQLQVIHQTLCTIQECAYKAQGTLRQFVIDDKGAIAIVAIGLSPFFHENNAFRGVKFACYVLESGIRASIGGTGKTMLLNHVIQRQSVQCFKGSGDSMDTAVDFHAWRDIARNLATVMYYHITIMDTQVLDFVFERTEGNPAALIKLLNSMLESKYICIEPEHSNIVILKNLDEMDTMIPQHIRARRQ
ncbi:hypothetical protein BBJ29_007102 [Phytophthora kernoviae]|uniref:Guanylate cyclase domain-containing protein n=1 Tax=Phytophthora kernoviae TaxID=325452 RepID=A0A3F2RUG9_9STRA|nr:hypothetical protein BBJ29_007102 [Phytophthora kernoviae]RLN64522.1 hypothetical protein BBP00_00003421 [Phytophthora kernoviae]